MHSWKYAVCHLLIQPLLEDSEDCDVAVDFNVCSLPVKTILKVHGDADAHIQTKYPSWSGNVADVLSKYFKAKAIVNVAAKFNAVNDLKGDKRRTALEDDVRERALDAAPSTPPMKGKQLKRGKKEAYDEVVDEMETPGGTKTTHITMVEVSTPEFLKRLKHARANDDQVLDQVEESIKMYDDAIQEYGSDGDIKKKKSKPEKSTKPKKPRTVVSFKEHEAVVAALEKTIKGLRVAVSGKKKKGDQVFDPTELKKLRAELGDANEASVSLMERNQELSLEVSKLEQKLECSDEIKKAAVAEAKCSVMMQMINQGQNTTPMHSRGSNVN